ncbi:hypothetical protein [Vibrio mimicus]|uniref:hypothetical protein n=1 Tax=Vibrio mimicus TaxID=674 RepID=UPI0002DC0546|nr:hypothetical protein [Vibrio mimicus]
MKKIRLCTITLSVLSILGCGGGDGASTPEPVAKYNFSFIALYETERSTLPAECAIFDNQPVYKDSDGVGEPQIDKYKLILAARSQTSSLKVLIHNKAGKVLREYTPNSSTSAVSFPQSQVPKDGYVTISHQTIRQGSPTTIVDGVTYHKSLLSSSMQFSSALSEPVSESISACIKQSRTIFSTRMQSIDDGGDGRGVFAFNTPEQNYWSLSPLNVELKTSSKPLLAVRYESLLTDNIDNINSEFAQKQYRKLDGYRMVSTRELGSRAIDLNLIGEKANDTFPLWSYSDTTTALSSAQLLLRYNNNAYLWQSLPVTGGVTFSYAGDFARNYVLKAQGANQGWSFVHNARLDGSEQWNQRPQDGINYNFVINDMVKPTAAPVQIEACGSTVCESGNWLRTYTGEVGNKYTMQRSFILVENGPGQQIRQVIYAPPAKEVVLPSYSDGMIDGLWGSNIVLAQVDLLQGGENVRRAFLRRFNDPTKEVKNVFELDPRVDGLGLSATLDTKQKDDSLIGTENYLLLTKP